MIYVIYDKNTGKCGETAYSTIDLIPKDESFLEITEKQWRDSRGKDRKIVNGQFTYSDFPPTLEDYDKALEDHLKEERISRGYTLREPSDYKGSSVQRWNQDAEDWIAHRDEVMLYGIQVENDYKDEKPIPTLEQFKASLPNISWTIE